MTFADLSTPTRLSGGTDRLAEKTFSSRRLLKVLIIMPLAEQRGGSEMALFHLMRFGRAMGVDWQVCFLEAGPMVQDFAQMGIRTFVVAAGRLRQPHRMASTIWRLSVIIRENRFDAILSWMGKPHLYGSYAALLAGVPALWYQHGWPKRNNWRDLLVTLMPASGILACSRSAANGQESLWPRRPIRVVYPGVDLSRFSRPAVATKKNLRAELGLPTTVPIIGIVGRLQRWKGFHHVVKALPRIAAVFPDVTCLMVGGDHALEPDYPAFLRDRISEANLSSRVRLVGLQRNIQQWMEAMDVVIHASDEEPFGMVLIEAMALGRPVVASDVGGPREIVTHGVNGLLWQHGDINSLVDAVLRILEDPELAKALGESARERATHFAVEHYARSVVNSVFDLLSPNITA
jgi:glycosyltransferase involved in cell wall biosynthesis